MTVKPLQKWHAAQATMLNDFYNKLSPIVTPLVDKHYSLSKIAKYLNEKGYQTFWGKQWNPVLIGRALKKMNLETCFHPLANTKAQLINSNQKHLEVR
ncbi:MAG: hypothetical protein HAW67_07090 [Endozoicomonadaceae bacterium]|nr:hypothetical protein [Endozoicomonadaceae bacterium]